MVSPQNTCTPERRRVFMAKLYQVCCPKCNNKTDFYRYGKDSHGHRSTSVRSVGISGRQIHHMSSQGVLLVLAGEQTIQLVLSAEGQCMCITIEITTFTTPAQTRNAVTLYLRQSPRPFQRHPCPSSLERRTSSGCAIPSM